MIRLALVVVLAACFSKPGLTPNDGPGSDADGGSGSDGSGSDSDAMCTQPSGGLTLVEDPVSHRVTATFPDGASMTFADSGSRYPYPIQIRVAGDQIVAAPGPGCGREDVVGIAVFPIYSVGGAQTPTNPNIHPLDEIVVGPANIQLASNWTYQHAMCNGSSQHGNGRTTWSINPDGRVVRYDYLQPADNGTFVTHDDCSCIDGTPYFTVTSFMAVADTMIAGMTEVGEKEDNVPLPLGSDITDARGACFRTPAMGRVAMRWDDSSEATHQSRIRRAPTEIAFVNDIVRGGTPGSSQLTSANDYTLRTHLFFESTTTVTCEGLNNKLLSHASSPAVHVDGALIAQDGLGFYDDTILGRTHDQATTLHADNGRLEAGWTLRIRFPGYRSITTSVPSNWQHEADDTFYIYFPDGLANNGMVTITPECTN